MMVCGSLLDVPDRSGNMAMCTSCAVEVRRAVLEYRERVDVRRRRVGFTSPRTRLLVAVKTMQELNGYNTNTKIMCLRQSP
jgi:hypothetical protein